MVVDDLDRRTSRLNVSRSLMRRTRRCGTVGPSAFSNTTTSVPSRPGALPLMPVESAADHDVGLHRLPLHVGAAISGLGTEPGELLRPPDCRQSDEPLDDESGVFASLASGCTAAERGRRACGHCAETEDCRLSMRIVFDIVLPPYAPRRADPRRPPPPDGSICIAKGIGRLSLERMKRLMELSPYQDTEETA